MTSPTNEQIEEAMLQAYYRREAERRQTAYALIEAIRTNDVDSVVHIFKELGVFND